MSLRSAVLAVVLSATILPWSPITMVQADEITPQTTSTFSTAGNPKTLGIVLTLEYPRDWSPFDNDKQNLIQSWNVREGKGWHFAQLLVMPVLNQELTKATLAEAVAESVSGEPWTLPPGAEFLSGENIAVGGQPGALVEFKMVGPKAGMRYPLYGIATSTYWKDSLVQLVLTVGLETQDESFAEQMLDGYRPGYLDVVRSLKFEGQWEPAE